MTMAGQCFISVNVLEPFAFSAKDLSPEVPICRPFAKY